MALTTGFPEILVGVAVAAALIPPASVAGLGLALMDATIFYGAFVLTFVNLFGLEAGGVLALLIKGISPRKYYEKNQARKRSLYALLVLFALLAQLTMLVTFTQL